MLCKVLDNNEEVSL